MYKEERSLGLLCESCRSLSLLLVALRFEPSSKHSSKLQVCADCALSWLAQADSNENNQAAAPVQDFSLKKGISIPESLQILNLKREDVNPTSLSEVAASGFAECVAIRQVLRCKRSQKWWFLLSAIKSVSCS